MLALRRSTGSLRIQSYGNAGIARICFSRFSLPDYESGKDISSIQLIEHTCFNITTAAGHNHFSKSTSFRHFSASSLFSVYSTQNLRLSTLSSITTITGNSSDLEDGFSELDEMGTASDVSDANCDATDIVSVERDNKTLPLGTGDESASEDEDEVEADDLNLLENERDGEKTIRESSSGMLLFTVITKTPVYEVGKVMSKLVNDGHSVERKDIRDVIVGLCRRKMFRKALQLSEWVKFNNCNDLTDLDYATHIDLVAKVHGLYSAEEQLSMIPESFQTQNVYSALLTNSVSSGNVNKVEEIFKKMEKLGFPLSVSTCNQLLVLYLRVDRKKIADVLMIMEKKNIKPSISTYKILIAAKGRSNDINGMEQVVEAMKEDGLEVNKSVLTTIAQYYISSGFKEKGEAILKEIECEDSPKKNHNLAACLLLLYASLGKEEDVERIWNLCKERPRSDECSAAIVAWGNLGRVDRAEEVFEQVYAYRSKLNLKSCNALLKIYAKHKLLAKGKKLIKKMSDEGCYFDRFTWDCLVQLYVAAGEVEKADSLLHKLMEKSPHTPFYTTYMCLLLIYGARGDIHNAEKIFDELRKCKYGGKLLMYQSLLEAYINAKTPAYGFRERMVFDGIYVNGNIASMLQTIDSFKKKSAACWLD